MKKVQQGFTLIELMIVVAIIGILAAIAIPQYQNFIARSQVTEALNLLGGAKTAIEDEVSQTNVFPAADAAALGTDYGIQTLGKYVASMASTQTTADSGVVTATFANTNVAKGLASTTIDFTRDLSGVWTCTASGGVPAKFLPKTCK